MWLYGGLTFPLEPDMPDATSSPARPIEPPLSIEQTQNLLGVSENTVRRLIERGRLRQVKIGRRVVIPAESIRALLADEPRKRSR